MSAFSFWFPGFYSMNTPIWTEATMLPFYADAVGSLHINTRS